jgi:hypothetical protein
MRPAGASLSALPAVSALSPLPAVPSLSARLRAAWCTALQADASARQLQQLLKLQPLRVEFEQLLLEPVQQPRAEFEQQLLASQQ